MTPPAPPSDPFVHVVYYEPRIPGNTGSAIRLAAVTGARLHLVEPLGFDLSEAKLKRAGLDYHDLAVMDVHPDFDAALDAVGAAAPGAPGARVLAFTAHADVTYTDVDYRPGDVLLFGPEPTGLPDDVLHHPRVTDRVRIPMLPGRRSLNLTNAASIVVYEAWRQAGFPGAAS
ncbi:tRNA (cytidine(34)-2'-O)-methyltransferase [Isoptericola jiangsuensis]|uniref:tRNA (cytidine(34)-2'-O)-methyltransferase n=1 Tax=Isoptericola jiangsuensis TaxID=548579 RepID=UPI003CCB9F0E